jgi:hypothetical protein
MKEKWLNGSIPDCTAVVPGWNQASSPSYSQFLSVPRLVATVDGSVPCAGFCGGQSTKIHTKNPKGPTNKGKQEFAATVCSSFSISIKTSRDEEKVKVRFFKMHF